MNLTTLWKHTVVDRVDHLVASSHPVCLTLLHTSHRALYISFEVLFTLTCDTHLPTQGPFIARPLTVVRTRERVSHHRTYRNRNRCSPHDAPTLLQPTPPSCRQHIIPVGPFQSSPFTNYRPIICIVSLSITSKTLHYAYLPFSTTPLPAYPQDHPSANFPTLSPAVRDHQEGRNTSLSEDGIHQDNHVISIQAC